MSKKYKHEYGLFHTEIRNKSTNRACIEFFFSCQNTNTSLMINRKIMATMYNLKDESEINNGYNERRRTHDLPPQTLFFLFPFLVTFNTHSLPLSFLFFSFFFCSHYTLGNPLFSQKNSQPLFSICCQGSQLFSSIAHQVANPFSFFVYGFYSQLHECSCQQRNVGNMV